MTAPVITPASVGASQLASRFVLQIDTSATETATWVTCFGMFNFAYQPTYNTADNSDFDSDGWGSNLVTSRDWSINASFRDKLYDGAQDPGQAALQAAAEADDIQPAHIRWFDRNGGTEAKEGYAYVQWIPQGGDRNTESTTQVTLNGQGKPTSITNPMTP